LLAAVASPVASSRAHASAVMLIDNARGARRPYFHAFMVPFSILSILTIVLQIPSVQREGRGHRQNIMATAIHRCNIGRAIFSGNPTHSLSGKHDLLYNNRYTKEGPDETRYLHRDPAAAM
jgi:hypothetical protein